MCRSKQPAKLAVLILWSLLLLCYGVGNVQSSTIHENSGDFHSLLDFKQGITKDPNGVLSNWSPTIHFCRWNGVNCTKTPPFRVMELNLTSQSLAGNISSSLRNLTSLKKIDLSNNNFRGPIPNISELHDLEYLSLSDNYLQGAIPNTLTNCSSLVSLDLSINNLTGVIPDALTNCSSLLELDLSTNDLTGVISPRIGLLSKLQKLNLYENSLTGAIPDALTNCSSLSIIDLSFNNLMGVIPHSIGLLSKLTFISLYNNALTGGIPPNLGNITTLKSINLARNQLKGTIIPLTNCSSLQILDLSFNNFMGVIPHSIGFLSNLTFISLYNNSLTGAIPPALGSITTLGTIILERNQLNGTIPYELWKMPNIRYLYLSNNSLSGRMPHTLPIMSSLTVLSLSSNMLSGELPTNIGDALPNVQQIFLGQNSFEGHIPASLGNPSGLESIDLSNNNFTGQIPSSFGNLKQLYRLNLDNNKLEARDTEGWEFFHALAKCDSLNILSLTNNELHGAIPNSIANFSTNLTNLNMGGNYLSGVVPASIGKFDGLVELSLDVNNLNGTVEEWIGKLTNLQRLRLQSNNFSGIVPPSISHLTNMSELDLSYNNFQGSIPAEIGDLTKLNKLDLSSNQFTGMIPETLGQLVQIYTIQLGQNILIGNIPCIFSHLTALDNLNLSHNSLSGSIPTCLNDLKLSELDLSYNNLQGKVPTNGIFDIPTVVSLNGNPGLCGGAVDFHMPSCPVDTTRRVGITNYLIKILIPIFGFMSLILLVYFLLLEKRGPKREQISDNFIGEHFENVTYNDLAQATDDFSEANMIGRGSYGSVYKGKLKESKMEVAVKVFNLEMRGAERSFLSECQALRSIHHRNLLPIITACSTVDNTGNVFKALVYELMPNGNLDTWLHQRGDEEAPHKHLGLTQRISIASNVADALDYLHHDCGRPTVHCDLKPSNILLDDDMNALLGDFGIARFYVDVQSAWAGSVSSIGVKGTIGYIPPEYGAGGHVSTSGDVYSFGIVLLEIFTGKRPTDPMFMDGLDIISFVENNFPEQIFQVIDSYLMEECKKLIHGKNVPENKIYNCLVGLLQVGLSCTRSLPSERSTMKQVASKLNEIKKSYPGWK